MDKYFKPFIGGNDNNTRYFTVVNALSASLVKKGQSNEGGRYKGNVPSDAAKKAFSRICHGSKIHGVCTLYIVIRETTRGSKKYYYVYKMHRKLKKNPKKVKINGKEIEFKYEIDATAIKFDNSPKEIKQFLEDKKDKLKYV